MILMRRAQRPLLFWLHCVSLFCETLRVGVQNPILCSMNSRAAGEDNNSRGFGCSLCHTLWESNLWFIPSPSSNIKPAVSHQQQHSQAWEGNTFHSWWVAAVVGKGCKPRVGWWCHNCKYIAWENAAGVTKFSDIMQTTKKYQIRISCQQIVIYNPPVIYRSRIATNYRGLLL